MEWESAGREGGAGPATAQASALWIRANAGRGPDSNLCLRSGPNAGKPRVDRSIQRLPVFSSAAFGTGISVDRGRYRPKQNLAWTGDPGKLWTRSSCRKGSRGAVGI